MPSTGVRVPPALRMLGSRVVGGAGARFAQDARPLGIFGGAMAECLKVLSFGSFSLESFELNEKIGRGTENELEPR